MVLTLTEKVRAKDQDVPTHLPDRQKHEGRQYDPWLQSWRR